MRNKGNTRLIVAMLVIMTIVVCVCAFSLLATHGDVNVRKVAFSLLLDIPVALLLVWADYSIIKEVNGRMRSHAKRILAVLGLTTILILLVATAGICLMNAITSIRLLFSTSLLPAVLWNLMVTLGIELFFYYGEQAETSRRLAVMEKEQAEYRFRRLKEQINPHFLFNSLNTIAALAYEDADSTNRFAKKLSSVYRYLLQTQDRQTVELSEELQFVDNYVYLEQIRFDGLLQVERMFEANPINVQVIPASVQMLVENAVKHNINTKESPLEIEIRVDNSGITVSNNIQSRPLVHSGGVGLANLKRQYKFFGKEIEVGNDGSRFSVFLPFIQSTPEESLSSQKGTDVQA